MTRRVLAIVAVLVATASSSLALSRLVAPDLWFWRTVLCLTLVSTVLAIGRSRTARPVPPTLAALGVGVLAVQALYFPEQALLRVLPTRATIDAVAQAIPLALSDIRSASPPVTESEPVAMLTTTGVVVVLLLAEMLAVGAFAPVWSGLPLAGLWSVPITLGAAVDGVVFAVAAASFLLLLAIQAREHPPRREGAASLRATAAVAAGALVATVVIAPAVLLVPAPVRLHTVYDLVDSGSTRLDLGLDLRDDLLRGDDEDVLVRYTGASPAQLGPLQAYTLEDFDGSSWDRGESPTPAPADGVLWPQDLDGVPREEAYTVDVVIDDLQQDRLLVPGEPREVRTDEPVGYVASSDELAAQVQGTVAYSLEVTPRALDPELLDRLDPSTLVDVPPELLTVPDTGYGDQIRVLAQQVVTDAGAQTPYQQAVALQNWLRDPAEFVYSTVIAPPQTTDAVWDFLNDRQGYCVQFATAMVVMARSLGIPTRVAVGFLPGEVNDDGVGEISPHDAHAWPQLLFPEMGWVRFEPTPAVRTGDAPSYAPAPEAPDQESPTTAEPEAPSTEAGTTAAPTDEASSTATGSQGEGEAADGVTPWWLVLVLLVGVAGAAVAVARRRAATRGPDARDQWRLAVRHLERAGFDVPASLTPRAVHRATAGRLDPDADLALAELAEAVEQESYGRSGRSGLTTAELTERVELVRVGAAHARQQESLTRV